MEKQTRAKALEYFEKNEKIFFGLIIATFSLLFYMSYTIHNIPYTAGWGNSYADMMIAGKMPYRDFYYYLPPGNLLIDLVLWKFSFGHIFIYTMYRVIERIIIILGMYNLLCKFSKPRYAAIGAMLGAIMLSAQHYDMIGDYNQTTLLLGIILTSIYVKYVEKANKSETTDKEQLKYLLLGGNIIGISFLVKQTIFLAEILIFFIALTIFFIMNRKKSYIKSIIITFLGILIPITIISVWLLINNAFIRFLEQVYLKVDSKGSVISILSSYVLICLTPKNILAVTSIILISRIKLFFKSKKQEKNDIINYFVFSMLMLLVIIIQYINYKSDFTTFLSNQVFNELETFSQILNLGSFVLIIVWTYKYYKTKDTDLIKWIILLSGGITYSYNRAMAAQTEITNSGSTFIIAIIITFILSRTHGRNAIIKYITLMMCIIIPATCMSSKLIRTYLWHGWDEVAFENERWNSIDVPGLEGYRVTLMTKVMYEEMYKVIKSNSESNSIIYSFPNIRIFNVLLQNENMNYFVPVPFYDVCSDEYIKEDIETLMQNPPDIVIWLNIENAFEIHENAYRNGKKLEQRKFQEWIINEAEKNNYTLIGQYNNLYIYKLNNGTEINYTYFYNK